MIMYHSGGAGYIEHYTGNFNIIQHTNDGDIILSCDDGSGGTTEYLRLDGGSENITVSKRMAFIDNAEIYLGTGSDFYLWHNGSNTYMYNNTGDFVIQQRADNADITFGCDDGAGSVATYFYLDGSSATHDGSATTALYTNWPDKSRITVGTSHDLQIYHDGSTTMFQNQTGNLKFRNFADDSDIMFETDDGSGSYTEYLRLDGSEVETTFFVNTRHNDSVSAKFGTSGDLTIQHDSNNSYITANGTGDLYIKQMTADKDITFQCDDGSGGETEYFRLDGSVASGGTVVTNFPDNSQIAMGSSRDFRIYHDGNNTYFDQNGTGALYIRQTIDDQDIIFECDDGSGGNTAYFQIDGGSEILQVHKDLYALDSVKLRAGNSGDLQIYHNATDSIIQNDTGDLYIVNGADDKDIVFKCDDGSGGTETYFFLDGSANGASPLTVFPDNSNLAFGAPDTYLMHNGTDFLLDNYNSGNIHIRNNVDDKDIIFSSDDGSGGTTAYITLDGSNTDIDFHKNTHHLDNVYLKIGSAAGGDLQIYHNASHSLISNQTGNLFIRNQADDGDIKFQCDDGSGGDTDYITLDGGDVSTTIGTIKVLMPNLPTSNPSVAGQLWNDSGTLKISAG